MLKRAEALPKVREWITSNFEDKKGGCVAKRDIYDAYVAFCRANNYQTTNDATFGKIFKTIFPHVQVRRLVRRVKAKKWHYCDVTYRKGSSLFAAAESASSATAGTDDAEENDDDITQENVQRARSSRRSSPKKRKRSTKAAHQSESDEDNDADYDEEEEERMSTTAPPAKRARQEEEDEEDGDYRDHNDEVGDLRITKEAEEMEQEGDATPSAGATSVWSDSDDDSSSSSSYASPALCDAPRTEQPREEDKDLNHSITDTPVCATPAERPPAPMNFKRTGGDIELSASSALSVSSMLHSSSVFSIYDRSGQLDGTTPLPLFGPAKTRLDDSSEASSEAPPSLTSSSAEMFFSYQPSSATMADFIKTEKSGRPRPTSIAVTADREEAAASPSIEAPAVRPAPSPTLTQAPVHSFPVHHRPPPQHQHASFEPSPFEASRNLPIHSHAMAGLLHNHPTAFPTHTLPHYAYPPQPAHHASSSSTIASANQSSAFAPGQHPLHQLPPQHQHHYNQHQHQHQQHHQHQHQQHQYQQHQHQHQPPPPHFSYPHSHAHPSAVAHYHTATTPTGHPSAPSTQASVTAPSPAVTAPGGHASGAGGPHQPTDREMSPESVEIFISHLLTNKSSELMTLARQL